MFFFFSKVLFIIIKPIVWIILLVWRAYVTKNDQKRRRILRGCLWLLILMTNPLFSNWIFKKWEYKPVMMADMRDTAEVGIVLGGFGSFGNAAALDRLNFNPAANRLTDALLLYKKGLAKRLLISGGDGEFFGKKISEAEQTKHFLTAMGVPDSAILIEGKSRNTRENARFAKALLAEKGLSTAKCLVITSAFHAPRSAAIFKKEGFNCPIFPVNFYVEEFNWSPSQTFMPDRMGLYKWELFIKEWVGYGVYRALGYL